MATRRRLLRAVPPTALLALTGCLGLGGNKVAVLVHNRTSRRRTVTVDLAAGSTTLLHEQATIAPRKAGSWSFANPDTAEDVQATVDFADGDHAERTVRLGGDTGVKFVDVTVDSEGVRIDASAK